jgi:hypothetical protein
MWVQLCISIFFILGCNSGNKTPEMLNNVMKNDSAEIRKSNAAIMSSKSTKSTFFDSVLRKSELSILQIREHTRIDSMWYTDMFINSVFIGDTILGFRYGLKGVIITFDDRRNCIYKFLLIFNSNNDFNSDYKIISSDCDRDESLGYTSLSYKILNDSVFETSERHFDANSDTGTAIIMKWKLDQKGKINSMLDK